MVLQYVCLEYFHPGAVSMKMEMWSSFWMPLLCSQAVCVSKAGTFIAEALSNYPIKMDIEQVQ